MSKKEHLLRQAEEFERQRRERERAERPYNPSRMIAGKMPFGCWLWIVGITAVFGYIFLKLIEKQ